MLTANDEIVINACSHTEIINMKFKDFLKPVKPKIIKFSAQSKV